MYKRILIVIDPQPASHAAIEEGLRLAAAQSGEVTFFTMQTNYPLPIAEAPFIDVAAEREFTSAAKASAERVLATARASADKAGVMSHSLVGHGDDAATAIIESARHRRCELIVVATEGRNSLMRLLTGSAVPGLITASPLPVLVCRPNGVNREVGKTPPPRRRAARRRATRAEVTAAIK